jgi:hypothetical protein
MLNAKNSVYAERVRHAPLGLGFRRKSRAAIFSAACSLKKELPWSSTARIKSSVIQGKSFERR